MIRRPDSAVCGGFEERIPQTHLNGPSSCPLGPSPAVQSGGGSLGLPPCPCEALAGLLWPDLPAYTVTKDEKRRQSTRAEIYLFNLSLSFSGRWQNFRSRDDLGHHGRHRQRPDGYWTLRRSRDVSRDRRARQDSSPANSFPVTRGNQPCSFSERGARGVGTGAKPGRALAQYHHERARGYLRRTI